MFHVGVKNRFRARHFLLGDFGEESRPHEHEYAAEWVCSTMALDENGFCVDIALLEELLGQAIGTIEGRLLNELEFFRERQCSVENMCLFVHQNLFEGLESRGYPADTIVQSELKIWESDTAWASYVAP
jgi:6-pyruvoyltetrahydropterin/6-carboxytetrahydropterin synthase